MPRVRVRKTQKGLTSALTYEESYKEVTENGTSIRLAATKFGLNYVSLSRFIKKKRQATEEGSTIPVTMGYRSARRVFDVDQEKTIVKYIIKAALIFYGLPPKEIRKLAFQLAVKYSLSMPDTWKQNAMAGEDWFSGFIKRNPELSIRCAQASNLSKATTFNVTNVTLFYDNLSNVMNRYKFEAKDIYNIHEIGVTTVQRSETGAKEVGALTSGERGILVTVALAVNAIGNNIPPILIFPQLRYRDHFVCDGPVGCVGAVNASGWMGDDEFLIYLNHFQKHTKSSVDNKILLLLDNHQSHISIRCLDFCKENGIIVLSFPPHCSHKLQPIERSIYGPFKRAVNSSCDTWMRNNPGKTMTIYDIPSIVKLALPLALTQSNIIAGFQCTGICPFNRDIFTDVDFAPSYIIDRSVPENTTPDNTAVVPETSTSKALLSSNCADNFPALAVINTSPNVDNSPVSPNTHTSPGSPGAHILPSSSKDVFPLDLTISPEIVRSLPKALARTAGKRKHRKSAIYTDTPEKEAIHEEHEAKNKKQVKKKLTERDKSKSAVGRPQESKGDINDQEESDSDEENCFCLVCLESYNTSHPREKWVQCIECRQWSHEECTRQEEIYILMS